MRQPRTRYGRALRSGGDLSGAYVAAAAVMFGMAVSLGAQGNSPAQTAPVFEAASIKRSTSTRSVFVPPRFKGVTMTADNVPVEAVIWVAYGVRATELVGGPDWIRESSTERFDIIARAPGPSTPEEQRAMLRQLLEDRFALRVHRETRDMSVYVLTVLDENGRLGPALRSATKSCAPAPMCSGSVTQGKASYRDIEWPAVVQAIAAPLDRRLVDRTGLSGRFDFDLTYGRGLSADLADSAVDDIFTAVRQQLGLKLEPGRVPMEVLVVDSVSRPTPD